MKNEIYLNKYESETLAFFDKLTIETRDSGNVSPADSFRNGGKVSDDLIRLEIAKYFRNSEGKETLESEYISFSRKKMIDLAKAILDFCE